MSSFKERVLSLWPGSPIVKIAETIGMTDIGLHRLFREDRLPKSDTLLKIHEASNCDLKWLMTGIGSAYPDKQDSTGNSENQGRVGGIVCDTRGNGINIDDFVFIPRYDLQAAAGHGYFVNDEHTPYAVAFRRFWIENYLHANPNDLSCIAIKGDSMEGVLNERDLILVNHAKNDPGDGLFVLRHGNNLIAKRTQRLLNNKLLISSANEAYEAFEIDLTKDEDISIIGKIEWFGRQV